MKKLVVIFLTLIIAACLSFNSIKAQEIQEESIQKYTSVIQVNNDGTIEILDEIHYDFASEQRHGIFWDFKAVYEGKNSKGETIKWKMDLEVRNVEDENGNEYEYKKISNGDMVQLKIGDPNKLISGLHVYRISYKIKGGMFYFSDHDELYWNAIGGNWEVPIKKAYVTVYSPVVVDSAQDNVRCFTGAYGSTDQACTITQDQKQVRFETSNVLNPYEGMSVVIKYPKGVVTELLPKEVVPFFETIIGKIVMAIIAAGAFFWYIIYPIKVLYKWFVSGRDPYVGSELTAFYDAPKTDSGRFLTPAETGTLVDEYVHLQDITGTIVDLARRGYLEIIEEKKNVFILKKTVKKDSRDKLVPLELFLYEKLFTKSEQIKLSDIEFPLFLEELNKKIYTSLVDERFFPKDPNSIRNFYTAIFIFALMTINFPLAIIAITFGIHMPRKTKRGAKEAMKARGLKNFLKSQEMHFDFNAKKSVKEQISPQFLFEKLLPFAIAFGVEKEWVNKFKDYVLKVPDWYQSSYKGSLISQSMIAGMHSSFRSMNSVMSNTVSSTGRSSGFSSGGGFSGGGGGGGGGGSW
ncbi:hypothetical protein A2957_03075 [Candidatus Roizmanbacteria bacterium RIFCSPLOWO2_01_FULL_38_11]|uniref:DUF2207 domain-containing protein n=1 Tax=Candidatus Roizmanbacteria bacterium RIFCSPLOWO2_01_FULL_38_11 TaxID=1802060 RepID=A0A1F7ILL5_9BACT|nr:MAG: hypothetical protein A2957_03075 [Candidatus Roizmanbacteria bacterium RIFCSPLOWO2_01_FULL_38_11]